MSSGDKQILEETHILMIKIHSRWVKCGFYLEFFWLCR